ncbi:MAG: acyl-ACP thioesterase domain-containing protein [Candidatus Neomarinimicrobiota bacterium]
MTELIRNDKYTVHSYEVDFGRRIRLSGLNRYMQESAWQHAETLGAGYASLISRNFAWVLTRATIRIEKLPGWGEQICLATWPSGRDQFFAYRDFLFTDQSDNEFGRATTSWCVIDIQARRPQPVAEIFPFRMPDNKELMFPERPPKIETPTGADFTWQTKVGYQDLDANEHANNVRYIDWIYETFPLDFLKSHNLRQLDINYLAETFYGEEISVVTQQSIADTFIHSVGQSTAQNAICRARTVWK